MHRPAKEVKACQSMFHCTQRSIFAAHAVKDSQALKASSWHKPYDGLYPPRENDLNWPELTWCYLSWYFQISASAGVTLTACCILKVQDVQAASWSTDGVFRLFSSVKSAQLLRRSWDQRISRSGSPLMKPLSFSKEGFFSARNCENLSATFAAFRKIITWRCPCQWWKSPSIHCLIPLISDAKMHEETLDGRSQSQKRLHWIFRKLFFWASDCTGSNAQSLPRSPCMLMTVKQHGYLRV